ncbi:hypothetical protein FF011L_19000 [Roseimaritima multifibrata]|uniref:DUF1015 domain-containing protein n=1 Tax=Roseimaritima multifibrata TaxID=1930274 RepID=A0A517ME24_9BACT|nr:DUF1015 domain-containing protein [Roseimaritima multifibrata]QDS93145.1 hypothetical protein FF011L_19000 [Roseimaritima multifibrata]
MPEIQAFHGIRYNLGHVGSLADVVAPPYDVIDPKLQSALYEKHPANVVRIILNRDEPGDAGDVRYERAGRFLKNWQAEGVLEREAHPAIYVYHQHFEFAGQHYLRRGFLAGVRLQRFGEGNIYPHEETHSKAKIDRLKLTNACQANCSPIFGLYPDAENETQWVLEEVIAGVAGLEATDSLGVKHTIWPIMDAQTIAAVAALIEDKPMFIADGHHRYETACNYRDQLIEQHGPLPEDHPANFVMTMCVGMSDSGMIVLPTHRLLHGTESFSSEEIIRRLGNCFDCRIVAEGPEGANEAWEEMEVADEQGLIGLYATADKKWLLCEATEAAMDRMAELAPEKSEEWRSLGVSLLHRLVFEDLLGAADHPKPTYVHQVSEVVDGLEGKGEFSENESTEPFTLGALVMPASLDLVEMISLNQERMPAKSTYFYPKLLSGLVLKPLA